MNSRSLFGPPPKKGQMTTVCVCPRNSVGRGPQSASATHTVGLPEGGARSLPLARPLKEGVDAPVQLGSLDGAEGGDAGA
jgi:hypothetical protein